MLGLELVLPDGGRVAVAGELTIGRAPANAVRLSDPSVSRRHARIRVAADGSAELSDAGSSYGTWVDGRRVESPVALRAGARIRIGDQEIVIDRVRSEDDAGHTLVLGAYALKRLEAAEGERRWVLKDLRSGRFRRLSGEDAELLPLLDGSRSESELVREAEALQGPDGPGRLALLVAALGARGLLSDASVDPPRRRLLTATHTIRWAGAAELFSALYRAGGRRLLTRPALVGLAAVAAIGLVAFLALIAGRYGTPFVVADKVGIGAVVFAAGRLAVAAVHEAAHGLVMESFGRPVRSAGLKFFLVFPYAYVDTSDAWFEPRRRRIAVSAAGPASDVCLGGIFALLCLASGPGGLRDVFFQLAFGAYLGAFFNLNPTVERDGYHVLVDVLREPRLRQRASEQLRRHPGALSGVVATYMRLCVAWSALGVGVAVALSLRYRPTLEALLPDPAAWLVVLLLCLAPLVPLATLTGSSLWRGRHGHA